MILTSLSSLYHCRLEWIHDTLSLSKLAPNTSHFRHNGIHTRNIYLAICPRLLLQAHILIHRIIRWSLLHLTIVRYGTRRKRIPQHRIGCTITDTQYSRRAIWCLCLSQSFIHILYIYSALEVRCYTTYQRSTHCIRQCTLCIDIVVCMCVYIYIYTYS